MRPHEGGKFDGEVSPRQDSCSLKKEVKNGHFVREKTSGFQNFLGRCPRPRWGLPPDPQLVLRRAMHGRVALGDFHIPVFHLTPPPH